MIRDIEPRDLDAITAIYNHYVLNTTVTFEEEPVVLNMMESRVQQVQDASLPWIVLEHDQAVVGYAYATKWKERSAYRFSVEISVYLSHLHQGNGFGTVLYDALLTRLKPLGINSVAGGITLPNDASVALHEKFGMQKVAHFSKVGFKFGQWLDVGYWQLCLDSES